jgi:hypothetical protein
MNIKRLAPFLLLAAIGGWLLFRPVATLQLENVDRGGVDSYRVNAGDSFSIMYQHSIYRQPVTEEFSVGRMGELVLTGVRSESGAVLEYFGFTDSRTFHAMNRPMRDIMFRVAIDGAQVLTIGGRRISFLSLGDPGDRIMVRMATVSPAVRGIAWAGGR